MNKNISKIPSRIENAQVDEFGNPMEVAGAKDILDDDKGKRQNVINQEVDESIGNDETPDSIKGRIKGLEDQVGEGGTVDERIEEAVAPKANSSDVYPKTETYNKTQLNNMITTPNQEYVTLVAESGDTLSDIFDGVTGAADTTYRVGNWDGSANSGAGGYDVTVYSEYAYDGTNFVHLSTKTQIGEIFDISAYHATGGILATYDDLADALGENGANVPVDIRRGGMSVKYVSSSDNKYVQFKCKTQSFSADPEDWYFDGDDTLVDNPEFIEAKTDSNGRLLEARRKDKTKTEYWDFEVRGNFINKGIQKQFNTKVDKEEEKSLIPSQYIQEIDNPEFSEVILDNTNKVVFEIRKDGKSSFNNEDVNELKKGLKSANAKLESLTPEIYKDVSDEQVQSFCQNVLNDATPNTKIFVTITDSHACGNYETSEITNNAVKHAQMAVRVAEKIGATAIVHLGDAVNDGSSPATNKKRLANYMGFQRDSYIPFLYALGHHEMYPWSSGNTYALPREDVNPLTLKFNKTINKVESSTNPFNYYCDFDNLRCIFVDTCYRKWGVTQDTISWISSILQASTDKTVIIFTHVPPIDRAFWIYGQSFTNSSDFTDVLNDFVSNGGNLLAYVHGHTHWDNVIRSGNEGILFDLYSITSCINVVQITPDIEAAVGGHPENAARIPGTIYEYAFDVICVDESTNSIKFYRFGAGQNRDNSNNN